MPEDDATASPTAEIVCQAVGKVFGTRRALEDITTTIEAGDLAAIVGSSGCGKTVLLHHMIGLHQPDEGRVLARDHGDPAEPLVDLAACDLDGLERLRLHWSVVFQRNALFTGTVEENISLWLREHTAMTDEQIRRRVRDSVIAATLDPDDVLRKQRDSLSGGMAKRVAIARAIATDPVVMFYDEPTTGLDPVVSARIHDLVFEVHHSPRADRRRRTTIIVTHDRDLLRRIRPRIIMLDAGRLVFDGAYEAFIASDLPVARQYLEQMPVLNARQPQ